MKIKLLIPTKQYSNITFEVEAETEQELDKEILRLWNKYYNFFDKKDNTKELLNQLNSDRSDKKAKHGQDFINDLPEQE